MPSYTPAEQSAIIDYERYMRALRVFLSHSGPETTLPPYPDIAALTSATRKGYRMIYGEPKRYIFD